MRMWITCADCGAWFVGPWDGGGEAFARTHLRVTVSSVVGGADRQSDDAHRCSFGRTEDAS